MENNPEITENPPAEQKDAGAEINVEPVKDIPEADLKKLALAYCNNTIFGSWQLPRPEDITMSFPVLMFLEKEKIPSNLGAVYEYYKEAAPRSCNGYPIFFSCHFLSSNDYKKLLAFIIQFEKKEKEFLGLDEQPEISSDGARSKTTERVEVAAGESEFSI